LKHFLILFFSLLSLISRAQIKLDTSKLAVFSIRTLTLEQIALADSLLIAAVDYYNSKAQLRGEIYLMKLDDNQYAEYLNLNSRIRHLKAFLNNKDKLKKHQVKKLPLIEREQLEYTFLNKDSIETKMNFLKEIGHPKHSDSIVTYWNDGIPIDLDNYIRQYNCRFDKNGNCSIDVTCICEDIFKLFSGVQYDWKKRILKSSCSFTVHLNLENKKASRMIVKGF
jgi:hypothetical protein